MELRPQKEKIKVSYPTKKEVLKDNHVNGTLLLAFAEQRSEIVRPLYVATPAYIITPIKICNYIRSISVIITILSAFLLIINNIKINKKLKINNEEASIKKLYKYRKVLLWFFGIFLTIVVVVSCILMGG